ncbi:hypothetical protein T484DRAFT_1818889, partial [Baffinella frigidus]
LAQTVPAAVLETAVAGLHLDLATFGPQALTTLFDTIIPFAAPLPPVPLVKRLTSGPAASRPPVVRLCGTPLSGKTTALALFTTRGHVGVGGVRAPARVAVSYFRHAAQSLADALDFSAAQLALAAAPFSESTSAAGSAPAAEDRPAAGREWRNTFSQPQDPLAARTVPESGRSVAGGGLTDGGAVAGAAVDLCSLDPAAALQTAEQRFLQEHRPVPGAAVDLCSLDPAAALQTAEQRFLQEARRTLKRGASILVVMDGFSTEERGSLEKMAAALHREVAAPLQQLRAFALDPSIQLVLSAPEEAPLPPSTAEKA